MLSHSKDCRRLYMDFDRLYGIGQEWTSSRNIPKMLMETSTKRPPAKNEFETANDRC